MPPLLIERFFARTGVDALTGAFATEADTAGERPVHTPKPPPPSPAAAERAAALKAAMPAHALRIFESLQAARDPQTRAAIESTLPAHAIKALAALEAATLEAGASSRREDAPPEWTDLVRATSPASAPDRPLAIYAHFPFCAARCAFCPFYRYADPSDWRPYHDALLKDIDLAAAPLGKRPASAVYFGGGTPSDLPAEALASLLGRIRDRFTVAPDAEITIEGRASTFDADKIAALRQAGANRFSLGVQTFDGAVRQAMGRKLGRDALLLRLRELARAAGPAPIIVDLIYGLPGQSDESWEQDLNTVISEPAISGLNLYRLKVFPGSPLARLTSSGRASPASHDTMARRYVRAVTRLDATGFRRLSRWHWARAGSGERSLYNRLAKGDADVAPLGCGAGGKWNRHAFINTPDLATWFSGIEAGRKICPGRGKPASAWEDALSAQIERRRLAPEEWTDAAVDSLDSARALLHQWEDAGLLASEPEGLSWRLTLAGEYWSDRLLHALQTVLATEA